MESTIGSLIDSAEGGDRSAADALFAALYSELHGLAQRQLARSGVTLGVTTLLHEAYLAISSRDRVVFPDRARFMGYAARVMRGLIIDHARSRRNRKEAAFSTKDDREAMNRERSEAHFRPRTLGVSGNDLHRRWVRRGPPLIFPAYPDSVTGVTT